MTLAVVRLVTLVQRYPKAIRGQAISIKLRRQMKNGREIQIFLETFDQLATSGLLNFPQMLIGPKVMFGL